MPRQPNVLPAGVRLADKMTLAQLHRYFPIELVRESLVRAEKPTVRVRELPNEFMAYYPIMLCLYRNASQQEVLRVMGDGLQWLHGLSEFKITGRSGISQARTRVGSKPLQLAFEQAAVPLARPGAVGCFYKGLRLVAMDGTDLDLDDCEDNRAHFGASKNQYSEGAYPKARAVGLVEIGTRAPFAVAVGPFSQSENALAANLMHKLDSGMLCLADQLFSSFAIMSEVREKGAEILFRCREDRVLPCEKRFSDGSYLTTIFDSADKRQVVGMKVRVLKFKLSVVRSGKKTTHKYCLLTTLLNAKKFPRNELVALYRERWEFETMLDEVKTHLMCGQPLRSRTPDLVLQEIYGMMMAHYCIRALMYEAAASAKMDPDELSFTHSRHVVERNLPKFGAFPPSGPLPAHSERNSVCASLIE